MTIKLIRRCGALPISNFVLQQYYVTVAVMVQPVIYRSIWVSLAFAMGLLMFGGLGLAYILLGLTMPISGQIVLPILGIVGLIFLYTSLRDFNRNFLIIGVSETFPEMLKKALEQKGIVYKYDSDTRLITSPDLDISCTVFPFGKVPGATPRCEVLLKRGNRKLFREIIGNAVQEPNQEERNYSLARKIGFIVITIFIVLKVLKVFILLITTPHNEGHLWLILQHELEHVL